mmetsp:Transcript_38/g.43  ORF Transcript_38/g.43 Transcript_38/m.43 type:complete len:955 (+) Transcript_38:151-3015(+)
MAPAITTISLPFFFLITICVGVLVKFRECSSFSVSQNTGVPRSGFLRPPIFFATIKQLDGNVAVPSSVDDESVKDLFPVSLFEAADLATKPKSAETGAGVHDAFRFEWGRWIVDEAVTDLMEEMNEVEILRGDKVYDRLLELPRTTSHSHEFDNDDKKIDEQKSNEGRRFRISGGDNWDCILHILPKDMEWRGRWPTGSWAIVRTLTGMAEMALMRGPDRDGFYKKATATKLRGGGDGSLGGGAGGRGEDCVKYVGGALRSYSGVAGKTMLLEVVIRPPMGKAGIDGDGLISLDIDPFPVEDAIIAEISRENSIVEKNDPVSEDKDREPAQTYKHDEENEENNNLGAKMGLSFKNVGGLDDQLDDIVRRVLASRANPEIARRLGVNHVKGILLSGPPGCGKTLLARELSVMLGAREPQIVNGPEILDKFVGEAEKNVRELFRPAELEYDQVGDASALHVIILDELDAIARRRGSVSGDTTGVRDSVVNQLLSKMDGVKEANNILVIGLTNRPELLDPALVRPGRLEVQLRVELPDIKGRRDILRIHTRHMQKEGGLDLKAESALEDIDTELGIPAKTEYFTGAELAGLVRSAASFAIARVVDEENTEDTTVGINDFKRALSEVRPALGKQDEILESRFPYGVSPFSDAMQRLMRDLGRFTSTPSYLAEQELTPACDINRKVSQKTSSTLQSLLLVSDGHKGGTGVTALACWAASQASTNGEVDYVRLVTSLDLLTSAGNSGDDSARATAMVERFTEASSMSKALLVFDDIDQICAGEGQGGYSSLMLSTLRALLRSPTARSSKVLSDSLDLNGYMMESDSQTKCLSIIASTSRTDAVCTALHELFDETLVVPELSDIESVNQLFLDGIQQMGAATDIRNDTVFDMAKLTVDRLETVGCKTALRILERTVSMSYRSSKEDNTENDPNKFLLISLTSLLDDYVRDKQAAQQIVCNV